MNRYAAFLALVLATCASTPAQPGFATPQEAVEELVRAFEADDLPRAESVLGAGGREILYSGDEVADASGRREFVRLYHERHGFAKDGEDRTILSVGAIEWPVPTPLVRDHDSWRFDAEAGREEILARRDGDGVLEYARRFKSTEGQHDGLYWPAAEDEPQSPLGPLAAEAVRKGYGGGGEGPHPYYGYYYRILMGQGPHAPDGEYGYLADDQMIGGFAIVAYPAEYGNSGVMTFLVNHDGTVCQKDLGPQTHALAEAITLFDPDSTWMPVEEKLE
jgi:hypothetical protein